MSRYEQIQSNMISKLPCLSGCPRDPPSSVRSWRLMKNISYQVGTRICVHTVQNDVPLSINICANLKTPQFTPGSNIQLKRMWQPSEANSREYKNRLQKERHQQRHQHPFIHLLHDHYSNSASRFPTVHQSCPTHNKMSHYLLAP